MEKDIQAGVGWPFEPLEKDECIVSSALGTTYGVQEGETLQIKILMTDMWDMMTAAYNEAAEKAGWPKWYKFPSYYTDLGLYAGETLIQCKVTHMIDKTYGKMPDDRANRQIMMEYSYYIEVFAETTTFNSAYYRDYQIAYFKEWMLSTPDLAYQYTS